MKTLLASARSWALDEQGQTLEQFKQARSLPIALKAALMPDAHPGYGLPIGGVLAVKDAVIPYAVGVDIACRMHLTVLDWPLSCLQTRKEALIKALNQSTRFGIGAGFTRSERCQHQIMDENWHQHPLLAGLQNKAWEQLGTSGTGNHFVEFVELEIKEPLSGLQPGMFLALLSHSGSRGTGAEVARHYSRLAQKMCKGLPDSLNNLAWLELNSAAGQEYWQAMQLMGRYAAANHELIHQKVLRHLGAAAMGHFQNHHNFAWQEVVDGKTAIVHRKGATPAHRGKLGIIPGSMGTAGYVVEGKGLRQAINSCSHGAGRALSRKQAHKHFKGLDLRRHLNELGVELISAGHDEVPGAYKDIEQVMSAQQDMVHIKARFMPRIVKMAPGRERAED